MTDRLPWFRCYPEKLLNAMAQLTPDQMIVYVVAILRIYETGGPCADGVEAIATRCRMNRRRVSDALDALFRARKLTRVDGGITNPFAEVELRKQRDITAGRKRAGAAGGQRAAEKRKQDQSSVVANAIAKPEQTLSLSLPSLPFGDSNLDVDSAESSRRRLRVWDFDAFWRQYPHKVGKGAARKAFDGAMKKNGVMFDDLMLGLMRYAAKTDDRPWCNPATWLNQERWLDEPAAAGGRDGGKREGSLLDAFERVSGTLDAAEDDPMRDGPVRGLPAGSVRGP